MAAEVPTKEPLEFRAGDSVAWTKSLSDYPAGTYSLTYRIRGPAILDIVCTTSGTDFRADITAAQSAALVAGDYWIEGRVESGADAQTVYAANIRVLPNFATQQGGYDGRSFARRVRDALRQMVEGSAEFPEIAYTIFGERNVQLIPIMERMDALARFESMVQSEEQAASANSGQRTGIYMRFRSPR